MTPSKADWLRSEIEKLENMKKYMHIKFEGCSDLEESRKRTAFNVQYTQIRNETIDSIITRYTEELKVLENLTQE